MSGRNGQVHGLQDVVRRLAYLGADLEQAMQLAVIAGGQVVANDAKRRAPKLTRTLSRSIHVEAGESSLQGATALVGTDVVYAAIHEYGGTIQHPGGTPYIVTSSGAKFLRKDGRYPAGVRFTKPHPIHISAQPYLRPALDENRGQVSQAIGISLQAYLRRVLR